jgi:hypothetical protein
MLIPKQFYAYAAVHRQYVVDCGDKGVEQFLKDSFAQSVTAAGGYAAKVTSFRTLSVAEADDIGLRRHEDTTWYRIDGSAIQYPSIEAELNRETVCD